MMFTYPQNLPGALSLIQQAVADETEDQMFYSDLMDKASTAEDREIISGIRDNEISHHGWFRQIYYEITGRMVPEGPSETFTPLAIYCDGSGMAMMGACKISSNPLRHAIPHSYQHAGRNHHG